MNVLIACEFSGRVGRAFQWAGHNVLTCDLEPTEEPAVPHHQGDVRELLHQQWDLMIAFPPCTYLCVTGNKWFKPEYAARFPHRHEQREEAVAFFMLLVNTDIPRIAVENPIGIMSTRFRSPDQIIQPYQFGHVESKKTCLWLKGLPPLTPTQVVSPEPRMQLKSGKTMPLWYAQPSPSPERAKMRNRTFTGIAEAMADQWGRVNPC